MTASSRRAASPLKYSFAAISCIKCSLIIHHVQLDSSPALYANCPVTMPWVRKRRATTAAGGDSRRRRTRGSSRGATRSSGYNRKSTPSARSSTTVSTGRRYSKKNLRIRIPRNIYSLMGAGAFDPFNPGNVRFHNGVLPVPNSLGNFTYVKSSAMLHHDTGTGTETDFLVLMWTPTSSAGWRFYNNGTCNEVKHALLDTDKPAYIRPARTGVRIMNTTRGDYRGGMVSVYESSMPLNLGFTTSPTGQIDSATVTSLKALLSDTSRTKKYSGQQLAEKPLSVCLKPASAQQFAEWQAYQDLSASTMDEKQALLMGLNHQGTSTVVIGFHDSSVANKYELQFQREDFCRFVGNTIAAQAQQPPPPLQSSEGFAAAAAGLPYS